MVECSPATRAARVRFPASAHFLVFYFQGTSTIHELWRMFHGLGRRIDYVISLGRSLQEFVRFQIDRSMLGMAEEDQRFREFDEDGKEKFLHELVSCGVVIILSSARL